MSRILFASAVGFFIGAVALAQPPVDPKFDCVDLQKKASFKTSAYFPDGGDPIDGEGKLPRGKHTFGGVVFDVGEKFIHLYGNRGPANPKTVEGIAVGANAANLYFLHATIASTVQDDTVIGKYVVNYDDKSKATIDVVYGRDVRDWYRAPESRDATRGKIVWSGFNPRAGSQGLAVRLFLSTWKNPEPAKRIETIDYISTLTDSGPFCIAISFDRKK